MKDCEAREWIARHKRKRDEVGEYEAYSWWKTVIQDIERIRGKEAADDLRQRMNRIKNERSLLAVSKKPAKNSGAAAV